MSGPLARMMPPSDGKHSTIKIATGRTYSTPSGGYQDVPEFDAHHLSANGWTRYGGPTCLVGPTSSRPTATGSGQPLAPDQTFFDTTLGIMVTWSPAYPGAMAGTWRGPTGAVA